VNSIVLETIREGNRSDVAVGPLAVHYCAALSGVSLREYSTNATVLADSVVRYHEQFRPDVVWLSADTWVLAQAMGANVGFADDNQPMSGVGPPCITSPGDIDQIPTPDPWSQGRCPMMLEALRQLRAKLAGETAIVACFDQYPFSLACALMGIDRVMLALYDDRSFVEALMQRCAQYTVAYATALADDADVLSGGDSPAGLLGPDLYCEVALPAERKVIGSLKKVTALPISLHICGNAESILAHMATSGADVLELDHLVDAERACQIVPSDVTIWGNIDPVSVLAQGSCELVEQTTGQFLSTMKRHDRSRFVLSSGCTLAVETPAKNLRSLIQTARNWRPTFL